MSTDSEIIQRSLDQPAAFAELFDRHARSVNAFATYRVGRAAAEDILSETFLTAFRQRALAARHRGEAHPQASGGGGEALAILRRVDGQRGGLVGRGRG